MNDEPEQPKSTRRLATQAGCCHWTPIFLRSADAQNEAWENPVTPKPAESAAPPVEKTLD